MKEHEQRFTPEAIDNQTRRASSQHDTPETRLVQGIYDLSRDYARQNEQSLERIWLRLQQSQEQTALFEQEQPVLEGKAMEQFTDHKEQIAPRPPEQRPVPAVPRPGVPRKMSQRFTLVAALLVAILLIGCVLAIVANVHPYTGMATINQPDPTPTPTKTPTPTAVPSNQFPAQKCPKTPGTPGQTWAAWYRLCLAGKFTAVTQTRHLVPTEGASYDVTLLAAYADRNELILVFDLGPMSSAHTAGFANLVTTEQGQLLSPLNTNGFSLANQHTGWISPYDTSSLPANQQTLTIKVTPNSKAQSSNPRTKVSFASFTIPLNKTVSLAPKQTVTANGVALTLSKLTISPSGAHATLTASHIPDTFLSDGFAGVIQTGKVSTPNNSYGLLTRPGQTLVVTGFFLTFEADLTPYHGLWTLTVTATGASHPWVFHLTS